MTKIWKFVLAFVCIVNIVISFEFMVQKQIVEDCQKTIDTQIKMLYNKDNEIKELYKKIEQQTKIIEDCQKEIDELSVKATSIDIKVTHYSSDETGTDLTASGRIAQVGRTVACNFLPLGTHVVIDGHEYIVEDTGGMVGNIVDIYVNSASEAMQKGVYYTTMTVLE